MVKLLVIVGPTASGKSALAVSLAEALGGEIISADSMQIYRGMEIATAAPTKLEQERAPHHLVGFLEPEEPFSVSQFKCLADRAVSDIAAKGKLPIICGGTGLYIDAVIDNICFPEEATDEAVRKELMAEYDEKGGEALLSQLRLVDPETAGRLHPNDKKRIVRALELYKITSKTLSTHNEASRLVPSEYSPCFIGLTASDRQYLYERINSRVEAMLRDGLIEEAESFFSCHDPQTAAQAIGYKELKPYLDGLCTLEEASESLKQATRRYAKRQLTWFRKNPRIHWLEIDRLTKEELFSTALAFARESLL